MRVPNSLLASQFSAQMSQVSDRLSQLQTEVSSGLRIQAPSDDPNAAVLASSLQSGLAHITQYQSNVSSAKSWLTMSESALGQITSQLQQARTLALQGANPQSSESLQALATQINNISSSIMGTANTSDGSHYIFAGYKTTTVPFSQDPTTGVVSYAGDSGKINTQIGESVSVQQNADGATIFNMGGAADSSTPDVFTTLSSLATAVQSGNTAAIQTGIQDLDKDASRINVISAQTGDNLQQLTLASNQLQQNQDTLTSLLSDTQDTDMATAATQLSQEQYLLQAASYVASTLTQAGLLNYLR